MEVLATLACKLHRLMEHIWMWLSSYMRPIGAYLDGGLSYWLPPPCTVVLSTQRGVGMAFVRTEGTAVPSVLAE